MTSVLMLLSVPCMLLLSVTMLHADPVRPFDFIIDGELLRKSLQQHLLEHDISPVSIQHHSACKKSVLVNTRQLRKQRPAAAAAATLYAAAHAALVAVLVMGMVW
jgi:hypothetical protein